MKLTKLIYLASPYSHKSKAIMTLRLVDADMALGRLQDKYPYAFIGPITQSARTVKYMNSTDEGFGAWERRGLTYVSRCDELWVLDIPGWQDSVGVQAEIAFAYQLQIPVKVVNHRTYQVKTLEILE